MKKTAVQHFNTRMAVCQHLFSRYPAWVATSELVDQLDGGLRANQRVMRSLVDEKWLECDNANPPGYRVIKNRFKGFK